MRQVLRLSILNLCLVGTIHAQPHLQKGLPTCFLPGAGGGNTDSFVKFPQELKRRGIDHLIFDIGKIGTVVERAQRLKKLLEDRVKLNPSFKCHVFAYSMGGVVARYAYHHISLDLGRGKSVPARTVFESLTTFSSPHRGTPLADWLTRYAPRYSGGMEDLAEEKIVVYNNPQYPATYSPVPTKIPVYSYLTYIEEASEADDFIGKFGFNMIANSYEQRGLDPANDGVVPLLSQAIGEPVAALNVAHGYFTKDIGLRPWAPDIYELHWHFLNGSLDEFSQKERFSDIVESRLFNVISQGEKHAIFEQNQK